MQVLGVKNLLKQVNPAELLLAVTVAMTLSSSFLGSLLVCAILVIGTVISRGLVNALECLYISIVLVAITLLIVSSTGFSYGFNGSEIGSVVLMVWTALIIYERWNAPTIENQYQIRGIPTLATTSTVVGLSLLSLLWSRKTTPLTALTHLFPEDNAGWLSVARMSVNGNASAADFIGGGNSPIVGVLSSLLNVVTNLDIKSNISTSFEAMILIQNSYIITILFSSYLAGKIVLETQIQAVGFSWSRILLPSCSSVFTFSLLSVAFIEFGHLSFVLSSMFGLMFISSQTKQGVVLGDGQHSKLDFLRLLGFGLAWWPMIPVVCAIYLYFTFKKLETNRNKVFSFHQNLNDVSLLLIVITSSYFAYRSVFKSGFSFTWPTQSDGGVFFINGQLTIGLTILIFLGLITANNHRFRFPISKLGRAFFISIIVFWGILRLTNDLDVGYQTYGSRKTLFLLFVLTVPVFFHFIAQLIYRTTSLLESVILCVGILMMVLSSTTGFQYFKEPSIGNSNSSYSVFLTEALRRYPNSLILCVNADPMQSDSGYYCNRMSAALTVGDNPLSFNWGQAMLNPDRTPFGSVIPLSETFGEKAKVEFKEIQNSGTQDVKIMIFPPLTENVDDFIWDDGRWWLNEIEWPDYLVEAN